MPPSGSGTTRRSHTKSRKGCRTCKRRHIRCDENFPQCGNCTKHNVRCDYMEQPEAEASQALGNPDLRMTPQIEQDLRQWRESGVYPFPSLGVTEQPPWNLYSPTDLRLIYHISSIANQMQAAEAQQQSVWVRRVPLFLKLASHYDYVMHALLALSASHLGWITACPATVQLSYHHRGLALKGLPLAIGNFSKQNSDAVLAASILLSWQATDWRGWQSLMQGTATVIDLIQEWKEESEFKEYLEEQSIFHEVPRQNRLTPPEMARILEYIYTSLRKLEPYCHGPGKEEEARGLNDLMSFVRNILSYCIYPQSADQQFERLHPLKSWLFFLPISFLKRAREFPDVMILLAHFYAVALAVEPLFPAVGAAWFGSLAVGPIREIHRGLVQLSQRRSPSDQNWPLALMEFPLEMKSEFHMRMGWLRGDEVREQQEFVAQEMHFPPSPSVDTSSGSSEEAVGGGVVRVPAYDLSQIPDLQINPLSSEAFFQRGLWRGWSTASQ